MSAGQFSPVGKMEISVASTIVREEDLLGTFFGWGTQRVMTVAVDPANNVKLIADSASPTLGQPSAGTMEGGGEPERHSAKLNVLRSISIAGCDLLGSCLYTAGVCAANSGKLAPICLGLVTWMLYYFRLVYCEAVTALPVNGGTYNILLNTTSKKAASFVGCLSLLSYTATAIVSAYDSVLYLAILWPGVGIQWFTVVILVTFTAITLCGVKESSTATLVLFSLHFGTVVALVVWGFVYGCLDSFTIFTDNIFSPLPEVRSSTGMALGRNAAAAIFFGYASALLGITGFETASNYIEEIVSPAAFVSTVNWMWVLAGTLNPLISVTSMMVLPMEVILAHPSDMLAVMADRLGGEQFKYFLCIDAVLVLCGGVLTAIIGVTGLIERMAKDRVVPKGLAAVSSWGSCYVAIISFSVFCIALFLCIFDPNNPTAINRFGGVFAISFLSVLACFAFATILLKLYRSKLARLVITKWWQVIVSFLAVILGIAGNIVLTPDVFAWFLLYLFILMIIVGYMFARVHAIKFFIWMIRRMHRVGVDQSKLDAEVIQAYAHQSEYKEFNPWTSEAGRQRAKFSSFEEGRANAVQAETIELSAMLSSDSLFDKSMGREALRFRSLSPVMGRALRASMDALDGIVSEPFVYFIKRPSPVSIHLAVEYIASNESSDCIYIVHFADDRRLCESVLGNVRIDLEGQERLDSCCDSVLESYHQALLQQTFPLDSSIGGALNAARGADVLSLREDLLVKQGPQSEEGKRLMDLVDEEMARSREVGRDDADPSFPNQGKLPEQVRRTLPTGAKQVVDYTSIIDTFYPYKRIHSLVVRGSCFSPSAAKAVCKALSVGLNNSIMGVPDTYFKFPFSRISGCRLVVQDTNTNVSKSIIKRLASVLKKVN